MHRFRRKQDLKRLEYNNNISSTNESQISAITTGGTDLELPSIPPTDFRTSLILPTLTKRFSVLRRGEKANNHNDTTNVTKTFSTAQESSKSYSSQTLILTNQNNNLNDNCDTTTTTTTTIINKEIKKNGRTNLTEISSEDEELNSENPSSIISSVTLPISVNTSISTSSISNNNDGHHHKNQEVLSDARKFYDPSIRIQNVVNVSSVNSNDNDNYINENVYENESENNKNDKIENINKDVNKPSNGLLVNPIKDRPKLPRLRTPPLLQEQQEHSWKTEFTTLPKNSSTPSQLFTSSSSLEQISLPDEMSSNFNNSEQNSLVQPSSPRSPLDKLTEGLYNLKLQSPSSLSPSSPLLYNTQNLSQTSLRSFRETSVDNEGGMESPMQKLTITNSLQDIEDKNVYISHGVSTTSTSLKRIETVKTTDSNMSNNSNNSSMDSEGDDESEYIENRNSNATGIMYLKNKTSFTKNERDNSKIQPESSVSNMNMSNTITSLQKNISRGGTIPPPKPQPPPLSLTDTLIASGQSDIAHQVMAMRRVQNIQNVSPQHLLPQHQFHNKQVPLRKWSKRSVKNISEPQLVSTSSNVKTVPIVQLGQPDDDKFRRKRDSETGIGKSLRKIKDVFTSDSESTLFGKKRTSLSSSNENLFRKFVSDENLNQRYMNNEKRGDLLKRRAFSTREKDKPDDKLRQDIRNNFTTIMKSEQRQKLNGNDYIPGDRSSTPINSNDKWTGQPPLYDIYALKRHAEMITRYSSNKKVDNQIITSRPSSQSSLSITVDVPNETESIQSSPISPFSDYPSSTSTPPPISPRNPLRQLDKGSVKYSTGSQNSISDTGSDDKRDSKDSKASSRLMSIFNYSNRTSKSSSRNSRNSKNSDINNIQIPQTINNIESYESNNKIIRRTIIITKPCLPPLPEDSAPSTPTLSPQRSVLKKNINLDDEKIQISSDGRQLFLSKKTSNGENDEKDEEIDDQTDSTLLNIPIQKVSLSARPPTPIPSPNTRENAMELPYGIPIPPIPSPYRISVTSKTSKRTSKSSIVSSSSKYNRKSIGNKSAHSSYGESIYDYYDYSDQEGADDEDDSNSTTMTMRKQLETQHVEVLEMSNGSYVWKVVNGLRGEDMEDRYSYYYAGADNDYDQSYSQMWSQDFGRLNYDRDLEGDQFSNQDHYTDNVPNSSHLSAGHKQKHNQYLTSNALSTSSPNRLTNENHNNPIISTPSSNGKENFKPRTSVYIAKDVPLPKLLEEMSKGLGNVDLDEEVQYVYGGEVGAGGTGVVGGVTFEEKLDQVMRTLGVDVYIDE